jgi:hypothetical protein
VHVIFEGNVHTFTWAPGSNARGMAHDDPKTGARDIYLPSLDPLRAYSRRDRDEIIENWVK